MAFDLSANQLEAKAVAAAKGKEVLHQVVGFYFVCFGHAEHQLTRNLAHILGYKDFEQFNFLAKNMDLRQKVDRLERACQLYNRPIGPGIHARIKVFNTRCRNARNDLTHSDLLLRNQSVYCMGVGATVNGKPDNVRPTGQFPTRYTLNEIRAQSLWLIDFAADLDECAVSTWHAGAFEVGAPRSFLP